MLLVYDMLLVGYFGNKKIRERIMRNFFWLGMYIDIFWYCKLCFIC